MAIAVTGTMPKLSSVVAAIPQNGMVEAEVLSPLSSKVTGNLILSNAALPPFIAMPQSSMKLTNRVGNSGTSLQESDNEVPKDDFTQVIDIIYLLKNYMLDYKNILYLV